MSDTRPCGCEESAALREQVVALMAVVEAEQEHRRALDEALDDLLPCADEGKAGHRKPSTLYVADRCRCEICRAREARRVHGSGA